MTSEEIKKVNENHDTRKNGNPYLYPDTLYIGALYKSKNGLPPAGKNPYILVETGHVTQEYLLINIHDGMPINIGGPNGPGYIGTAEEWSIRKFLAQANMELVAADAKTYYEGEEVENINDYVQSKKME